MNIEIFETMKARSDEYMKKFNELATAGQTALDTYGPYSAESLAARELISDFRKKNEVSYNRGQCIAYLAYSNYKNGTYPSFVVDEDFYVASDIKDFLDTVREAEIETFILTCKSTSLMENIHDLVEYGCVLVEPCKVMKHSEYGNFEHLGLMFRVNKLKENDSVEPTPVSVDPTE